MVERRLIVVVGETLIDLVPSPDGELTPYLGGGPFNTARALARLGVPVQFMSRISTDRFGGELTDALRDDGVGLRTAECTDDPTTLALVELDSDASATYRFYTAGTAAPGLSSSAATLPSEVGYLHVGTLSLALEPIATTVEAIVAKLPDDVLLMVDPNCRPDVLDDASAYRERLARIAARADVLKLSIDDLGWLAPELAPIDAARALAGSADARSVVLLTRGAAGATVISADSQARDVAAPQVEVIDTIGAGDCFSAGWLAWWSQNGLGRDDLAATNTLIAATEFACLVAARTCERTGAVPPTRDELCLPTIS